MADLALTRENFVLHKLHSLSGVVPVGFYMVQHLTLNSFSLAGPQAFDGVISFFDGIPKHVLLATEILVIWIPLLFHAVYGLFITGRAKNNFIGTKYGWSQNRMYLLQRVTGVVLFVFLIVHVCTTTVAKYLTGNSEMLRYAEWHEKLRSYDGIWLVFYLIGILCATYHLSYGLWNFCIRWGITISDKAQLRVQKLSLACFIVLTVLGWGALLGFLRSWPVSATANPSAHFASLGNARV